MISLVLSRYFGLFPFGFAERARAHLLLPRVAHAKKEDSEVEREREGIEERIELGSTEFTPADCVSTRFPSYSATKRGEARDRNCASIGVSTLR